MKDSNFSKAASFYKSFSKKDDLTKFQGRLSELCSRYNLNLFKEPKLKKERYISDATEKCITDSEVCYANKERNIYLILMLNEAESRFYNSDMTVILGTSRVNNLEKIFELQKELDKIFYPASTPLITHIP